jgi:hypothetical protein
MTTNYTINGNRIGTKTLSEFGLEIDMIREMSDADIRAYFTAENLVAMFGECNESAENLAALASATIDIRDAK